MSDKIADDHQHAIERFWHNYLLILKKSDIPGKSQPWYRRHAELYISAHKGLRLGRHQPRHVDNYLNAKSRMPDIEEWRFHQIVDASQLLFISRLRQDGLMVMTGLGGGLFSENPRHWHAIDGVCEVTNQEGNKGPVVS